MPALRSSTASSIATRLPSTPFTTRRGCGAFDFTTSACTSTGSARRPSRAMVTQVPASAPMPWERNRPLGSGTSAMPSPVISKQPTSSVGPNRFFEVRTKRSAVWRSPSKWHTTSTRCSSSRGPAIWPSFVTWPTSSTEICCSFATRIRLAATSRTWAGPPAKPAVSAEATVCTESTMTSCGSTCSIWPSTTARSVSAESHRLRCTAPVRSARSRTWPSDSSALT
jgi:hypothetical protein